MAKAGKQARVRTAGAVDPGIREIRRFYAKGQRSLRRHKRLPYGEAADCAEFAKLSPEKLRKARSFASTYTLDELNSLCRRCIKEHYPINVSHVICLITVKRAQRTAVENQAIKGHWSKRRLDEELRKRYGSRRKWAGRKPRTANNVKGIRWEVIRLSKAWQRLYTAIYPPLETSAEDLTPQGRKKREKLEKVVKVYEQLSAAQQGAIKAADKALAKVIARLERKPS